MRKKFGIAFVIGVVITITGFALINDFEGSASGWSLPIPGWYRAMIFIGSWICLFSGLLVAALNKIEK